MQTPGKQMQKLDWFSALVFQAAFVTVTGKGRCRDGALSSLGAEWQFLVWLFRKALGMQVIAT